MLSFNAKLFHKVCLPIIGLTLALLLSIIFSLQSTHIQESQNALTSSRSIVETSVRNLIGNLNAVPQDLNKLNALLIQNRWHPEGDLDWLRAAFYDQIRAFPEIDALYFGAENNEFIGYARFGDKIELMIAGKATKGSIEFYQVDSNGLPREKVRERANFPIKQRPWYLAAQAKNEHTWAEIFTYHAAPIMAAPTSAPVFQGQKLIGVVGNNIFLNSLSARLSELKHSDQDRFILLDEQQYIVADSTLDQPFIVNNGQTERIPISDLPDPFSQRVSDRLNRTENGTGSIDATNMAANTSQLALWFPLAIPNGPSWQAAVLLNDVHFEQLRSKQLQRLLLISIGGIVFIIFTLSVLLKLIVRPLAMINQSANRMIAGDLNQSINYHSHDEIGVLARTFNKLAKELNSTITQLKKEKEVVEHRDKQLNDSNAELARQRDYLANMQDLVGDGFFEWSADQKILKISPNFAATLGFKNHASDKPYTWQKIIHPDYFNAFIQDFTHHFEQLQDIQHNPPFTREILAQGATKTIWILIKANKIQSLSQGAEIIVGSIQNIDENHRQREQIIQLNARTALAVEASQCGIWDWDVPNDKLIWDKQMYELYKTSADNFSSAYEAWFSRLHPEDRERCQQEIEDALTHRRKFDTQFRIIWPSGEVRHIRALAKVVSDTQGNPLRMVGVNFDNTKVIQYQERLKQANDESLQFAYRISHDIRGPLVSTLGLLDITQGDLKQGDTEEVAQNLNRMKGSISGLTTLVSDILALCKADLAEQPPETINIELLLTEIFTDLRALANANKVKLKHTTDTASHHIPLQHTRIKQILRNLIENGIKYYAPERAAVGNAFVSIDARATDNKLNIEIRDNGLGIPTEYHDQIFNLFSRFHPNTAGGSGLGMSIVQKHVQAMHGSLSFESTEGAGTTFYLSLPLEQLTESKIA